MHPTASAASVARATLAALAALAALALLALALVHASVADPASAAAKAIPADGGLLRRQLRARRPPPCRRRRSRRLCRVPYRLRLVTKQNRAILALALALASRRRTAAAADSRRLPLGSLSARFRASGRLALGRLGHSPGCLRRRRHLCSPAPLALWRRWPWRRWRRWRRRGFGARRWPFRKQRSQLLEGLLRLGHRVLIGMQQPRFPPKGLAHHIGSGVRRQAERRPDVAGLKGAQDAGSLGVTHRDWFPREDSAVRAIIVRR